MDYRFRCCLLPFSYWTPDAFLASRFCPDQNLAPLTTDVVLLGSLCFTSLPQLIVLFVLVSCLLLVVEIVIRYKTAVAVHPYELDVLRWGPSQLNCGMFLLCQRLHMECSMMCLSLVRRVVSYKELLYCDKIAVAVDLGRLQTMKCK